MMVLTRNMKDLIDPVADRLFEAEREIALEQVVAEVLSKIRSLEKADRERLMDEAVMSAIQERMEEREAHGEVEVAYEYVTPGKGTAGVRVSYRRKPPKPEGEK